MTVDFEKLQEVFHAAVEHHEPDEWDAYLDQACAGDMELRRQAAMLLKAHAEGGSLLGGAASTQAYEPTEGPGTVIGPYKLLEQIGEGGFGVVFMAEQTQPVRRKVALKVIKPGMDTRQVIARFEAERQALALMEHPNIARVLDAGTTSEPEASAKSAAASNFAYASGSDSGRPYFVMELVRGTSMTEYCDQHNLPVRERLELFVDVCQAVQHAHQKGIIHRDIKPSNVLVTLHDGKPVVKVIDFGIAKAMGQQLTDKTLFTNFAQMIGTPLYMSPEQAEMSGLDVDTRSDIYSLGVLLYELLTGTTPFDKERLKQAGFDEIRRIIREEEPPKPSTRMSTVGQAVTTASEKRQSDPRKLSRLFRGELDWIVMKALEKDRNRRYETASAFATDVGRYLKDEAVEARPTSVGYRMRKFVRRNRAALATTLTVSVAVLVAIGGIVWAVRDRAAVAEQAAHDKAARQEKLEGRINQALEETEAEYERDNLPEARARIQRIDVLLAEDTEVSDEIRHRVDEWRTELGVIQRLEDLAFLPYERSLFLQTDAAYARVFQDIGIDIDALPAEEAGRRIRTHLTWKRLTEALDEWALLRHDIAFNKPPPPEAWPRKRRLFQIARAADPDELRSQARLAGEKWDLAAAERLAGLPDVGRLPAAALRDLAMVIYYGNTDGNTQAGRDSAVRLLLNALILRPGDLRLNTTCANWYEKMDPPRRAEAAHSWSIAVALRPENPDLRLRLADALNKEGRLDDAIAQYREAIRLKKDYADAHNNLGVALSDQGKLSEAVAEYRRAIALDPRLALPHSNLGNALRKQGKLDEAVAECRKAIELDPKLASVHVILGIALYDQKKLDEAIAEFRKAIETEKDFPEAHYSLGLALYSKGRLDEAIAEYREAIRLKKDYAEAHNNLGNTLLQQRKLDEAIAEFRKAIALDPKNVFAYSNLGLALLGQGELDEAIAEHRKAIELDPKFAAAHYNLGNALREKGQVDQAIAEYREAIRLNKDYAEAHCNLGRTLRSQGEFRQALEELRRGHELGSRRRDWPYPSADWVRECERLIDLDEKLPGFLKGETAPATPAEGIELARVCSFKGLNRAAAGFYAKAFADAPTVADDLGAWHRYNAACAAALAGSGVANDSSKLDEKEKVRLRGQAQGWLRADLAAWAKELAKNTPEGCAAVRDTMRHWQADADLAGVRGTDALARLPEAERQQWQKLWNDIADLLKRAQEMAIQEKK